MELVHIYIDISILIGFSIINHPFWGTPIFGNTHINIFDDDGVFSCARNGQIMPSTKTAKKSSSTLFLGRSERSNGLQRSHATHFIHRYTVIRVIANPCMTRRQKWKKATFVPKKAWILENLYIYIYRFFDMILISQKDQYDISCQLAR